MSVLRIARPTDRLDEIAAMYQAGLGLDVLGRFDDHAGYDGIMRGRPGAEWHLEFTRRRGHAAGGAPSDEHLLVLYVPDPGDCARLGVTMAAAGFRPIPSANPYWDQHGRTFEDIDGYRVVLQNRASPV